MSYTGGTGRSNVPRVGLKAEHTVRKGLPYREAHDMADKAEVERLVRELSDSDYTMRWDAATALGELGDTSAMPALIRALSDSDTLVRERAATALGRLGDDSAVPALMKALSDSDKGVRAHAATALGNLDDTSAVPSLIEALSDGHARVRGDAATALGNLDDTSAVPSLIEALSDGHADGRMSAAAALGKLGDNTAVPALIKVLSDSDTFDESAMPPLLRIQSPSFLDTFARMAAAEALGELGDTCAVPALIKALSDGKGGVRNAAAQALGKVGDQSAVPSLIRAFSDSDEGVREAAAGALGRFGVTEASQLTMASLTAEPPPMVGVIFSLAGSVTNQGEGPAFNVSLTLSSPALAGEQHTELAYEVSTGESVPWAFSIAPTASGRVPVSWAIAFDDLNGIGQSVAGTEHIEVEAASPTTVSVSYGGDHLETGAMKVEEGVISIIDRKKMSQPVGPSGKCSCGRELNLLEDQFCPDCGKSVAVEG